MGIKQKIVVGMSGGVDSSVAAYLLKQQGHDVIGMFMRNWSEVDESGVCTAEEDFKDVVSVCEKIGIPYYSVDLSQDYQEEVFSYFLKDYERGLTPNPDILCNREIKFKVFLEKAKKLGADFLATGHYADIGKDFELLKAQDLNKDQSYFLYTLTDKILSQVLFPLGKLTKPQVRKIASEVGLTTSDKKDSTGICFIGERKFREFLSKYLAVKQGDILTLESWEKVGTHQGVAYYTLGQRKGLGIGGVKLKHEVEILGDAGWFVASKDIQKNILYVVQGSKHPALYVDELWATDPSFVKKLNFKFPFHCKAKTRYRQTEVSCVIESLNEGVMHIRFLNPERSVTPGQSVVFYADNICLGGGVILKTGPSYFEQKKALFA
ncbi:MAG: tRNA 2-thiouridine(34) synthase MnmA [Bacteriovoracaceae bacterium]|nr:tRNA 2-thiouridine(34) synthase MnmA [Bacteriovoracaceae bacterium]